MDVAVGAETVALTVGVLGVTVAAGVGLISALGMLKRGWGFPMAVCWMFLNNGDGWLMVLDSITGCDGLEVNKTGFVGRKVWACEGWRGHELLVVGVDPWK